MIATGLPTEHYDGLELVSYGLDSHLLRLGSSAEPPTVEELPDLIRIPGDSPIHKGIQLVRSSAHINGGVASALVSGKSGHTRVSRVTTSSQGNKFEPSLEINQMIPSLRSVGEIPLGVITSYAHDIPNIELVLSGEVPAAIITKPDNAANLHYDILIIPTRQTRARSQATQMLRREITDYRDLFQTQVENELEERKKRIVITEDDLVTHRTQIELQLLLRMFEASAIGVYTRVDDSTQFTIVR